MVRYTKQYTKLSENVLTLLIIDTALYLLHFPLPCITLKSENLFFSIDKTQIFTEATRNLLQFYHSYWRRVVPLKSTEHFISWGVIGQVPKRCSIFQVQSHWLLHFSSPVVKHRLSGSKLEQLYEILYCVI